MDVQIMNNLTGRELLEKLKSRLEKAHIFHSSHDKKSESLIKSDIRHISEQEIWFAEGIAAAIECIESQLKELK